MDWKGKTFVILLILLMITIMLGFILPKTGLAILQKNTLNEKDLENLKLLVGVECLKNSQCSQGYECVENQCVEESKIDLCQDTKLYFRSIKLKEGDFINSLKGIITNTELPYLLPNGELVDNVEGKTTEYFYTQTILVGDGQIQKENGNYVIKPKNINDPIYTYVLTFSNPVDFSNKNIQGQVLRILGEEYTIGSKSTNSGIELISGNKKIKVDDGKNAKIINDDKGNVIMVEIPFNLQIFKSNIKAGENHVDNLFSKIKLNFYSMDEGIADVSILGNC